MGSKSSLPDPVRDMAVKYIEAEVEDARYDFVYEFVCDELQDIEMRIMSEEQIENLVTEVTNKIRSARVIVKFSDDR